MSEYLISSSINGEEPRLNNNFFFDKCQGLIMSLTENPRDIMVLSCTIYN
jgi:hypothetical protein